MAQSDKNILITGATGFVGRYLIREIVKYYPKKSILCLSYNIDNQQELSGRKIISKLGLEQRFIDLTEVNSLENLPKKPQDYHPSGSRN